MSFSFFYFPSTLTKPIYLLLILLFIIILPFFVFCSGQLTLVDFAILHSLFLNIFLFQKPLYVGFFNSTTSLTFATLF